MNRVEGIQKAIEYHRTKLAKLERQLARLLEKKEEKSEAHQHSGHNLR